MSTFSDTRLVSYQQRLTRLRMFTFGLLLVVLVPLSILMFLGFEQLKSKQLQAYQAEARSLVEMTNRTLFKRRLLTNSLPADGFNYYQQIYNPITKKFQQVLSPLSQLDFALPKISAQVTGLVGFFQFNEQGQFNTPVLPSESFEHLNSEGLLSDQTDELNQELIARQKAAKRVFDIVSRSQAIKQLTDAGLAEEELLFKMAFDVPTYYVFYRIITLSGNKFMQGYVVERTPYLTNMFRYLLEDSHFESSVLVTLKDESTESHHQHFIYQKSQDRELDINRLAVLGSNKDLLSQVIFSQSLRWPLERYSVEVSTNSIPMTSVMQYSLIAMAVIFAIVVLACIGFYQLGVKQLKLAEQRLNFVSSVSHELKTPLTSIRMYAEMLKSGMVASDTNKNDYYDYIFSESERLSRLINNILQLASLNHAQQTIKPEYTQLSVLHDIVQSKTSSMIEKHGFTQHLAMSCDKPEDIYVLVDQDAFSQVVINITDNAIKFFNQADINDVSRQKIDFIFRLHPQQKHMAQLEIRDYGLGISAEQEEKIFELFYRGGSELTRTTQGTGIGLALVNELMQAQQGDVKVERKSPGLSLLVSFKLKR